MITNNIEKKNQEIDKGDCLPIIILMFVNVISFALNTNIIWSFFYIELRKMKLWFVKVQEEWIYLWRSFGTWYISILKIFCGLLCFLNLWRSFFVIAKYIVSVVVWNLVLIWISIIWFWLNFLLCFHVCNIAIFHSYLLESIYAKHRLGSDFNMYKKRVTILLLPLFHACMSRTRSAWIKKIDARKYYVVKSTVGMLSQILNITCIDLLY